MSIIQMDPNNQLTVYSITVKRLDDYLMQAINTFNNFSAFNFHRLESPIRALRLRKLFKKDMNILQYKTSTVLYLDREIKDNFTKLLKWLEEFFENSNDGQIIEKSFLQKFDEYIENCYCSLIYVFICTSEQKMIDLKTNQIKKNIISEIDEFGFNKTVKNLMYKRVLDAAIYIYDLNEFIDIFNSYLNPFLGGNINRIYMEEIKNIFIEKNRKNVTSMMSFTADDVQFMITYIYGELGGFIARNYLYKVIEQSLMDNGTSCEILKDYLNQNSYLITITCGSNPSYTKKEFHVIGNRIQESERNANDCLITLGRESRQEFTNDITLPDLNETDSIFGFIFINRLGLNLIDISKESIIWTKFRENTRYKLKKGLILRFGRNSVNEYEIVFGNGVSINGCRDIIEMKPSFGFENNMEMKPSLGFECNIEMKISLNSKNKSINQTYLKTNTFKIGSRSTCDLKLKDCEDIHAEIFYDEEFKSYFIIDKGSRYGGTYRKLKKKHQIEGKKSSSLITLEDNQVFFVKDYGFLVKKINNSPN